MPKKYTPEERVNAFWGKVQRTNDSECCWEWLGYRTKLGYGQMKWNGRANRAHRISWMLTNGDIPNNLFVLHKCDNPCCVNPNHLFLGTVQENNADMDAKGRRSYKSINLGESHPHHKLTKTQVEEIREKFSKNGFTFAALGREYGVCYQQISRIVNGKARRNG